MAAVGVASALLGATACSGEDDTAAVDDGPTTTGVVEEAAAIEPTGPTEPSESEPSTTIGSEPSTSSTTGSEDATDTAVTTEPPFTTFAVVEVPETGVPGLDSDDSFCAAWSRFGGSWQVIQVAANFAPDPSIVPTMEVTAAPIVAAAYDAMLSAWPDELAEERDVVADGFFGPLDRRAESALAALAGAGASEADARAIGDAWETALAARQADQPVVDVELSDELRALVDEAASEFAAQRVDFVDDPSMRIAVETPLTDEFLATACPDQGALAGGEVDDAVG